VTLSSSSLGFYQAGVTRVVPDCHTGNTLLTTFGYCPSSAPDLNQITNDTSNAVSQIIVSFLSGTNAWQSAGHSAESDALLSSSAGVNIQLRDQSDNPTVPAKLSINSNASAYSEVLAAGTKIPFSITPVSGSVQTATLTLPATTVLTAFVKPGPSISPKGVIPAAGPAPFPYDVAPGAYVSIYGSNLASSTMVATQPYPTQIGDVQVLVTGGAEYFPAGQRGHGCGGRLHDWGDDCFGQRAVSCGRCDAAVSDGPGSDEPDQRAGLCGGGSECDGGRGELPRELCGAVAELCRAGSD
jgi:hypothetical protein